MRYLTDVLKRDLTKKMILLSGPRQAGKTTLAQSLLGGRGNYLNWDVPRDQKIIRATAWPKDVPLVVLDELHKYLNWKNFLKGVVDEFHNRPSLLVTGSARLETLRHEGDALTGRSYHYRLHPIDVAEARLFLGELSPHQRLERLIRTGGFPEAFLNPEDGERLRNDRFDLVVREDLRDLGRSNSVRGLKLLIELLRERVGGLLNCANLAQDLSVAPATVKAWVHLLESLYIVFLVPPYAGGLARSLRKEPKVYFYDAASASSPEPEGAILENLVACALLKYVQAARDAYGKRMDLFYFRDREKREVDFVVTLNRRAFWCIEVKMREDRLSSSLSYLRERVRPRASWQLVKGLSRSQEKGGVKIVPLAEWLDQLDFRNVAA
jgi:predicted AAA+ superfamily ATPase